MNLNVKKGIVLSAFSVLVAVLGATVVASFSLTDKGSSYRCTPGYGYDAGFGYGYGYDCVKKSTSNGGGGSSSTTPVATGTTNTGVNADTIATGVNLTGTVIAETAKFAETEEGKVAVESLKTSNYPAEWNTAYLYARSMGITTMPTIQAANMEGLLTRAELAKMLTVFSQKVLNKPLVENKAGCGDFGDLNTAAGDLAKYVKLSCELEIMGLEADGKTPLKNFMPNKFVTRAELATVYSRVLNGNLYDNNNGLAYWTNHIDALKNAGILTVTTPTLEEVRANVFLMMYRARGK